MLAVKKLPHLSRKEKDCNLNEISFLSSLPHPTIVKYFTSYEAKGEILIVTEYLEGGPLSQAKADYNEGNIAYAAREILRALQYLHGEMVVHRDLKSANIMFSVSGEVKLSWVISFFPTVFFREEKRVSEGKLLETKLLF